MGKSRSSTLDMLSPLFWVVGQHSFLKAEAVKQLIYHLLTSTQFDFQVKPDFHMIVTVGGLTATHWQRVSDQSAKSTGQSGMRPRANFPSYVARIAVSE